MGPEEVAETNERSNGLDVVGLGTVTDGTKFVFSRFDSLGSEGEPQVADLLVAEPRFADVDFEVVVGQASENFIQSLEVRVVGVAVDQHVVDVDDAVLDAEEDLFHGPLKRGWTA